MEGASRFSRGVPSVRPRRRPHRCAPRPRPGAYLEMPAPADQSAQGKGIALRLGCLVGQDRSAAGKGIGQCGVIVVSGDILWGEQVHGGGSGYDQSDRQSGGQQAGFESASGAS